MLESDPIQRRWRARQGPAADVVLRGDGSLHVMELISFDVNAAPPAVWQRLVTAERWEPADWIDLDTVNAACEIGGRRAIAGEASAHGSIGWLALTRAADDRLEWLVVSCWSNPFGEVRLTDTEVIATTTLGTNWHVPLSEPHNVRITADPTHPYRAAQRRPPG